MFASEIGIPSLLSGITWQYLFTGTCTNFVYTCSNYSEVYRKETNPNVSNLIKNLSALVDDGINQAFCTHCWHFLAFGTEVLVCNINIQ